jgi:uncharacterized protein YceH (UPF0502 family)
MNYSSVDDLTGDRKPRHMPSRELEAVEIRVLGSLAEKQMSTPEYYPLTLNALIAACNQKSNREPVMEVAEAEVQRALESLQEEKLAWRVVGGRAVHWEHNLDTALQLDPALKAVLTLLFLRGPQTPGELRGRSDRLHPFGAISDVEETLQRLAASPDPLVREIARLPGQKESRWMHLLGSAPHPDLLPASGERALERPIAARIQRLEEQIIALLEEMNALKAKLGE